MDQNTLVDKTMVTRAVIAKIEDEKKPEKIWAKHVTGYASPEKIPKKEEDQQLTPDIAAKVEDGINIYEIELDKKEQVEKWLLFSRYAENKNGRLILVVPNNNLDTIKRIVSNNAIIADFIYFDTA